MTRKATLAEIAERLMNEQGKYAIWSGEVDLAGDIYEQFGGAVVHPYNRIDAVMAAVRRSPLFERDGCIRACDRSGRRELEHPCFKLKRIEHPAYRDDIVPEGWVRVTRGKAQRGDQILVRSSRDGYTFAPWVDEDREDCVDRISGTCRVDGKSWPFKVVLIRPKTPQTTIEEV